MDEGNGKSFKKYFEREYNLGKISRFISELLGKKIMYHNSLVMDKGDYLAFYFYPYPEEYPNEDRSFFDLNKFYPYNLEEIIKIDVKSEEDLDEFLNDRERINSMYKEIIEKFKSKI